MTTHQVESVANAQPVLLCSSEAAAVDLNVLRSFADAQVDGLPDLVVELIDLYLEDAPQRMLDLGEALFRQDEKGLKQAAHCLKGSSGTLGARGMLLLCNEIERVEVENMFPGAQTLLASLFEEFERVRHTLLAERLRRS
jgi:HPt (histidine-containing phosphotransfer) domain-containing protein